MGPGTHAGREPVSATDLDYHAAMRRPLTFKIDAPMPAGRLARYAVIAWMVAGGIVALLVPVFLGVMIWGWLTGQLQTAP